MGVIARATTLHRGRIFAGAATLDGSGVGKLPAGWDDVPGCDPGVGGATSTTDGVGDGGLGLVPVGSMAVGSVDI